ncbi:hypothetical protein F4808DRAFT_453689 [Astrocystis sublimbata]|nr:hypothetical protein F4808DRAFT_453689 [Astrocystis sublimbata]
MSSKVPIRESVLEVDENSWIVGKNLLLSRHATASQSECCWSDGRGAWFSISEAGYPPPQARPLSPTSPIQLVHDAGDCNAAWQIGEAFLKVQAMSIASRTREHTTLNYLHDPANGPPPTFPIPHVLFHREDDNIYYLLTSRVPGATKQACVEQVANICKVLAQRQNDKICGVDGRELSETWMRPPQAVDGYSHEVLLAYCIEIGMDGDDVFVLHHCDMGPTNVIVDQTNGCTVGLIDWEVTGFVPKAWIRTKFCVCWAMDLDFPGEDSEKSKDWRHRIQLRLAQEGYTEVAEAWSSRFRKTLT